MVFQYQFLWSYEDDYLGYQRCYSCCEFVGKVEVVGFEVFRVSLFVLLLLFLFVV